jgi:hypothetical protein
LDPIISDVVEDLSCTVRFDAIAGSHHDGAKYGEGDHESEAVRPAPYVEKLSVWKPAYTAGYVGDNLSSCRLRVPFVSADGVGSENIEDVAREPEDKDKQPDPYIS